MHYRFNPHKKSEVEVRPNEIARFKCNQFIYLGLMFQENGTIDGDVTHRIKIEWFKWTFATGVLCNRRIPTKVKCKFYKTIVRPAILHTWE